MSAAAALAPTERPAPPHGALRHGGRVLTAAAVAYVALLHHGLGPILSQGGDRWWAPKGFLLPLAPDSFALALLLFGGIGVALACAIFLTTRSAVARLLGVWQVLAVALIVSFSLGSSVAWSFFHWRWTASMLLLAAAVAAAATAPWLARSWRRLPGWARAATYLPLFLAVVAYERNVTGTDPQLPFALSPWPVVQVFGFDAPASFLAVLWLAVGAGLVLLGWERAPRLGRVALALAAAAALPALWLAVGASVGLLPFRAGGRTLAVAVLLPLLVLGATALVLRRRPGRALRTTATTLALGGLLAALPLLVGQSLTRADYAETRNHRAQRVIDALARFIEREGQYPDALEELVATGDLEQIPRPRIGFGLLSDAGFTYQNFGTSYLLEFSAPRWVQCAYNPPWAEEDVSEEERAELEADDVELGGSWSCPSRPPELW